MIALSQLFALFKEGFIWLSRILALAGIATLPFSTTLADVFLLLALISMGLSFNWKSKLIAIANNPIARFAIGLFALFAIGICWSDAPHNDIVKTMIKNGKILYAALLIPIFYEQQWRDRAIQTLLISLTIIMILSYLKAFGIIHITERYHDAAVFRSHIQTNFLMAFYCYLLAHLFFNQPSLRWLLGILFTLAVCKTLIFSDGRSGYVVFALLMVLLGWQQFGLKGLAIATISILALASTTYFMSSNFHHRIQKVVSNVDKYQQGNARTSVGLRMSFAKNAISLIKERPIAGYGTGSLISQYKKVESNPTLQTNNVHNEYFNIGIQLGFIGIVYLTAFFIMTFAISYRLSARYRDVAQAVVIAIGMGCLFNSWLMDTLQGHFFAVMLAVCFAQVLSTNQHRYLRDVTP